MRKSRLFNSKTRTETGFDFVLNSLHIRSPYGKKYLKALKAFEPGQEDELRQELDKVEITVNLLKSETDLSSRILEILEIIKDVTFTIKRSGGSALSVVELFEIKTLLLQMDSLRRYYKAAEDNGFKIPDSFGLEDLTELLDVLDPDGERINTFYIYDSFSEKLGTLRREKREHELSLRRLKKDIKYQIESKYGITMTPKFEYIVSKHDKPIMERAMAIEELFLAQEDYMSAVFHIKYTDDQYVIKVAMEKINDALEEEELRVREELSAEIGRYRDRLLKNCQAIGEADFTIAKAEFALKYSCVKPEISEDHQIIIKQGRQLMLEDVLRKKGKSYKPVSIDLRQGVSCITGANMGGKTVTLKMVGQCALMVQQGFFIPAEYGKLGMSSFIRLLVGDSQNIQRGLSSFGSEMEELKDLLEKGKNRSLILIDEIANGTNPAEGRALTKSLVKYMSDKPYISMITTHFDVASEGEHITNLQVKGLSNVDFDKLAKEIRYANRLQRIEIISKYMDYSLTEVAAHNRVPRDALNIAGMLGLHKEIIDNAKRFMEDQ